MKPNSMVEELRTNLVVGLTTHIYGVHTLVETFRTSEWFSTSLFDYTTVGRITDKLRNTTTRKNYTYSSALKSKIVLYRIK